MHLLLLFRLVLAGLHFLAPAIYSILTQTGLGSFLPSKFLTVGYVTLHPARCLNCYIHDDIRVRYSPPLLRMCSASAPSVSSQRLLHVQKEQ